jgi:hypothetical protein
MRGDLFDVHAIDSRVGLSSLQVVWLDQHQPGGIAVGERTEEHAIGEREDRRVDADPEREREDGDEGEAAIAPQQAERVAEIAREGFERGSGCRKAQPIS